MAKDPKFKNNLLRAYGLYGTVGFQMVISVVLGVMGGWWLDRKFNVEPLFLIVGILLGAAAGFYNLYLILTRDKNNRST